MKKVRYKLHKGFDISFENLHKTHKKCTPTQLSLYHLSISLHRRLNFDETSPCFETLTVLDQIICTSRQINFQIFKTNRLKIGINTTANKLSFLNNKIALDKLNLDKTQFKRHAKSQFLCYGNT